MLFQQELQGKEHPNDRMFSCFSYFTAGPVFPCHCHMHLELVYVSKGGICLTINGQRCDLKEDSLAFVPMMAQHSIESTPGQCCEHMILQISPSCFRLGSDDSSLARRIKRGSALQGGYMCQLSTDLQAYTLLKNLMPYCDEHSEHSYAVQSRILKDSLSFSSLCRINGLVFMLLADLLADGILEISDELLDIHEANRIEPVLHRMMTHPETHLSLEEAAKMVNMSYFNFSRSFKRVVGQSFVDHQNTLRIRYAEDLLRSLNDSITQIADRVNFGSLSYFNRVFKTTTGLSPSTYRKRHRAKKD